MPTVENPKLFLTPRTRPAISVAAVTGPSSSRKRSLLAVTTCAMSLLASSSASAQMGGPGGGGGGGSQTQTRPTRNKSVGPQRGADDDDQQSQTSPSARPGGEPTIQLPQDPLAIPDGLKPQIGSDFDGTVAPAEGSSSTSYFPVYASRKGDYRLRLVPPLFLEHTRGLDPMTGAATERTDRESLFGLLYYQRRSPKLDADVVFPAFWRVRDRENKVLVLGPLAHREAPGEHDNWIAPLFFEGKRKDGGYFHAPLLLTTSHSNEKGAFTVSGLYFRDRVGRDVDWGVAPFVFHGDNGDLDGARKKYTLIPPALYFHRERELDDNSFTVLGPVIKETTAKREILDVAPFYFSIHGRPGNGGVNEFHTTLLPFFHYGRDPEKSLLVLPGYYRRVSHTADTMITPFYSNSTGRTGATSLTMAGPVLPLFYRWRDKDVGESALGVFPFYYGSHSQRGETFMLPLYGRFESYSVSTTHWVFPTFTHTKSTTGWETDLHPIFYFGRDKDSSHNVVAPIFWDFKSKTGRTTIGFPLFWRFSDTKDGTVTQVAANTLYRERKVYGGTDWQFHFLPFFSYGSSPTGYWWNVLFGLAGYEKEGPSTGIKALWLPINVSGPNLHP